MAFPAVFIDELIARNPIEEVVGQYVALQRKGSNLFGLCPFHGEKTASFSVAPEKQIYYCFGCHRGGGVIQFIMEIEGLSYPDAVRFLAQRAGLEVPDDTQYRSQYKRQETLWNLCREAARFFHAQLRGPAGRQAREYLVRRALSAATVTRFGLGFAPDGWGSLLDAMEEKGFDKQDLLDAGLAVRSDKGAIYDRFRNRLMFPILDLRGNVIGFGGRVMDDSSPKYLNSPETIIFNKRKNLFGLNLAKKSKQGRIILTEGYMDAIALHQAGFDCAVASLGTSLTQEHAVLLAKYTKQVVLTYDSDEAGQNATKRAIPMLEKVGLQVKVLQMQGAKDPDEYLKKFGAERFQLLLDRSGNQMEYYLQSLQRNYDLSVDEQRVSFLREAADWIAGRSSAVEREVYGARAAEAAGVSPETMQMEVKRAQRRLYAKQKKQRQWKDLHPAAEQQPKARGIRYENIRSAMAEEGLLRLVAKEPVLFDQVSDLSGEDFSSPLLGRVFEAMRQQAESGRPISLAAMDERFTPEEMAHMTAVMQKTDELVSEAALQDYRARIEQERDKAKLKEHPDLLAIRDRLKDIKGYGG